MRWEGNRAAIKKEEMSYPDGEAPLKLMNGQLTNSYS